MIALSCMTDRQSMEGVGHFKPAAGGGWVK